MTSDNSLVFFDGLFLYTEIAIVLQTAQNFTNISFFILKIDCKLFSRRGFQRFQE